MLKGESAQATDRNSVYSPEAVSAPPGELILGTGKWTIAELVTWFMDKTMNNIAGFRLLIRVTRSAHISEIIFVPKGELAILALSIIHRSFVKQSRFANYSLVKR